MGTTLIEIGFAEIKRNEGTVFEFFSERTSIKRKIANNKGCARSKGRIGSATDFSPIKGKKRFVMRIRRAMRKKPLRRPVKKPRLKRQRMMQQKKRLVSAGLTEEQLVHMNTKEIRAAIRETAA